MIPKLVNLNNLSKEENDKAKEICQDYKALPQSSTKAFTSKFKDGDLPLQAYIEAQSEMETGSHAENSDTVADVAMVMAL